MYVAYHKRSKHMFLSTYKDNNFQNNANQKLLLNYIKITNFADYMASANKILKK